MLVLPAISPCDTLVLTSQVKLVFGVVVVLDVVLVVFVEFLVGVFVLFDDVDVFDFVEFDVWFYVGCVSFLVLLAKTVPLLLRVSESLLVLPAMSPYETLVFTSQVKLVLGGELVVFVALVALVLLVVFVVFVVFLVGVEVELEEVVVLGLVVVSFLVKLAITVPLLFMIKESVFELPAISP